MRAWSAQTDASGRSNRLGVRRRSASPYACAIRSAGPPGGRATHHFPGTGFRWATSLSHHDNRKNRYRGSRYRDRRVYLNATYLDLLPSPSRIELVTGNMRQNEPGKCVNMFRYVGRPRRGACRGLLLAAGSMIFCNPVVAMCRALGRRNASVDWGTMLDRRDISMRGGW